jgi:hypothetical protein
MTFIHGKDTAVLINEFDMSAYFSDASQAFNNDTAETTAFGASAKSYVIGLADGTFDLGGMFDVGAGTSATVLESILATATAPVVTVHHNGNDIGEPAWLMRAHQTSYSLSSPIADIVKVASSFQATGSNDTNHIVPISTSGVQLTNFGNRTVSSMPITSSSVDNAASTSAGGMATLHVTSNTGNGTSYTTKVQHSADNSSWADLVTFTVFAGAAVTEELVTVAAGTVNRYLRSSIITADGTTGNVKYAISFARF